MSNWGNASLSSRAITGFLFKPALPISSSPTFLSHPNMTTSSSSSRFGAAAALLALSLPTNVSAFAPIAPIRLRRSGGVGAASSIIGSSQPPASFTFSLNVLSEDQTLHTAERLSGMSRGEIQHIFEDIDADGSGTIDIAELDLLSKYFPGESFTPELRKKLMTEIDTDDSGDIGLLYNIFNRCQCAWSSNTALNHLLYYRRRGILPMDGR